MKRICVTCLLSFILLSGCATTSSRTTNESMLNFLPYLNQKVAGYLIMNNVKSLDANSYKETVSSVCSSLPSCQKNSESMFNAYAVHARMVADGMFSVMLCDKEDKFKEMEDFSCNEQRVEVQSFEIEPKAECQFEANWEDKIRPYCPGFRVPPPPPENH